MNTEGYGTIHLTINIFRLVLKTDLGYKFNAGSQWFSQSEDTVFYIMGSKLSDRQVSVPLTADIHSTNPLETPTG